MRIAWGGGADRVWQGTISVSDGSLSEPQPLGIEADEPGSMWLDGDRARPAECSSSNSAARAATTASTCWCRRRRRRSCSCNSRPPTSPIAPATIEIPLADLSGEFVNKELDNRGNRLLVMRTPGDSLRVRFARDSLVFAPGETFQCTLEPHALPLPKGGTARIKIQLLGGGKELWSQQHDVQADRAETIPLEIPLPSDEGVYDVAITAAQQPELVAGGPPAVELETHDRRAAGATAGARSAAAAGGAERRRVHAGGRDRSGQSAMVREAQQAAAIAVDEDRGCRGCGRGRWATTACRRSSTRWATWRN